MGKMFDMDNPVWRFMGKVTDMFFLTCLWLLFSLPVVTIGAATCALCYCSMTLASNKEGYIREDFVRAFKENFKSATIAWIGMLALGIFFGADLYFYYHLAGGVGTVFFWIFLVLSVIFVFVALYVFPLLAWTDADLKKTLALAFVIRLDASDADIRGTVYHGSAVCVLAAAFRVGRRNRICTREDPDVCFFTV